MVVLLAGAAAPAFAGNSNAGAYKADEMQERNALQGTNLTLAAAIAAAKRHTGGKAFDADTDVDHGKPRVVVETNGPNGVQAVVIDARNGQIVSTHAGGEAD